MRLTENTGRKNYTKNCHLRTIAQLCRATSWQFMYRQLEKLVKQQYLRHMSWQYG